jgi:hypothetical protein
VKATIRASGWDRLALQGGGAACSGWPVKAAIRASGWDALRYKAAALRAAAGL